MQLTALFESGPRFKTLEDNTIKLTDDERQKVMDAEAVWHFAPKNKATPAIKKAVIKGKTYYYSSTHRCFQSASTLSGAIKDFFDVVKPSG